MCMTSIYFCPSEPCLDLPARPFIPSCFQDLLTTRQDAQCPLWEASEARGSLITQLMSRNKLGHFLWSTMLLPAPRGHVARPVFEYARVLLCATSTDLAWGSIGMMCLQVDACSNKACRPHQHVLTSSSAVQPNASSMPCNADIAALSLSRHALGCPQAYLLRLGRGLSVWCCELSSWPAGKQHFRGLKPKLHANTASCAADVISGPPGLLARMSINFQHKRKKPRMQRTRPTLALQLCLCTLASAVP